MNDYAMHQARTSGSLPGSGPLEAIVRNWIARRAVRRLESLPDYLLKDIGATREDIEWAGHQSLSHNAALLLEERQRNRQMPRHG